MSKLKVSVKEALQRGYKKTPFKCIYININGCILDLTTGKEIKPTATAKTRYKGKQYNIVKLLLHAFKNEKFRPKGQIKFKDGNKQNLSLDNIEYKSTLDIKATAPKESDIIKAIRLYFEVEKNISKQKSPSTYYHALKYIYDFRSFKMKYEKEKSFFLFDEWINSSSIFKSKVEISLKNGYEARNGTNIINYYLSLLIDECLQDEAKGLLKLQNFIPPKKTQRQILKEYNESMKQLNPNHAPLPLRKRSIKETLKDFRDFKDELTGAK